MRRTRCGACWAFGHVWAGRAGRVECVADLRLELCDALAQARAGGAAALPACVGAHVDARVVLWLRSATAVVLPNRYAAVTW